MKLIKLVLLLHGVFTEEAVKETEPEAAPSDKPEEIPSIKVSKVAHLDITVNGEAMGTVDIGLFEDQVPKTVRNFMSLCEGWEDPATDVKYEYGGSKIHRISPEFVIQGFNNF